jgi:MFS family permease
MGEGPTRAPDEAETDADAQAGEDGAAPSPASPPRAPAATRGGRVSLRSVRTFESFSHAGFRWYFLSMLGQMASLNMQNLVRGFLAFELTGSFAALGTVFLVNAIPGIGLALVGGALADRVRQKRTVVQIGQTLSAVNALAVGGLLAADLLIFEHLLIAGFVQGALNALSMPARQSMLPEVVGLDRLMNAVAVNAAGRESVRLLAPAAGGYLIALFGPHWVYFLMSGTYMASVAFLTRVPLAEEPAERRAAPASLGSGVREIRAGLRYLSRNPVLAPLLAANTLFAMLSLPYQFLLPGFVADVLNGGPEQLGLLLSVTGLGSLAGAVAIASMPPRRRGLGFLLASLLLGVALVAFSASHWILVTVPILVVLGVGQSGRQAFSNVLAQTYAEAGYRGRVMSVYQTQRPFSSLGTFFVGLASAAVGVQLALGVMGAALVVLAAGALIVLPSLRKLD